MLPSRRRRHPRRSPPRCTSGLSAGLEFSRGKTTIYLSTGPPSLAAGGHIRTLTARALRPCVIALGDHRHGSLEAQSAAMLRGDGSTVASGHPVLGTPVGTDAFVRDAVSSASARATRHCKTSH